MRRANLYLPAALLAGLAGGSAFGQLPGSAVQLPTFSQFSVGTTVSVPDRGSAFMGGINRSASGRNSFRSPLLPFRPFKNTAIGSEQSAMGVHVSAWIHDFEAMDEYLLSQPPRTAEGGMGRRNVAGIDSRPAGLDPARHPAGGDIASTWNAATVPRSGNAGANSPGGQWQSAPEPAPAAPLLSVAEERRRREAQAETRSNEAEAFFVRGQEAEASGKANVARIYYQMAARRATGELQHEVLARLRGIAQTETAGSLAHSGD